MLWEERTETKFEGCKMEKVEDCKYVELSQKAQRPQAAGEVQGFVCQAQLSPSCTPFLHQYSTTPLS